jgi:hypothetical protein
MPAVDRDGIAERPNSRYVENGNLADDFFVGSFLKESVTVFRVHAIV